MTQKLNRLWEVLHNVSDGKFAAHEIRESALDALSEWGFARYQWVYDLLPLQPKIDKQTGTPENYVPLVVRTKLKNVTAGLLSGCYSPTIFPCPLSDLVNIEQIGEMTNI